MAFRLHTVNGKAVKIIERYPNTTLVEYVKSGVRVSVKSDLIRSYVPSGKKSIKKNPPNNNNQNTLF